MKNNAYPFNLDARLRKAAIGFDRVFDIIESLAEQTTPFPPYDLEKTGENRYRVTLALAGYGPEDVDVEVSDGTLSISGKKKAEGEERDFLHRGIAFREFKREFRLADYVEVTGGSMVNGLLVVDLERKLPEARKPRKVDISTGQAAAETAAE